MQEQTATESNKQYFNDAQMYCLTMNPRDLVIVGGRGLGKGAIQARRIQAAMQNMEGSMGGFVSPSVKRAMTNILPSMLIHLERWGFKRDIHYTVGRKPWKALHWKQPIFTPQKWDNTISFYNGSVVSIISQDRPGTSNSLSLDYIIVDEAKFIDFEQLKDETFQANRGNEVMFSNCPLHHGMTITSDMPTTKRGSWFLSYKDEQDPELIAVLEALIHQRYVLQREAMQYPHGSDILAKEMARLDTEINRWRKHCLIYKEYSSIENLAILGEDFIRRAKRDLPPLTFMTSIMCIKPGIQTDGFYGSLQEETNLYTASNSSLLNAEEIAVNGTPADDCLLDSDLQTELPICIALDANANINWLVAGQLHSDGKIRVLRSFFTKYERKLPELIDDFAKYYAQHRRKQIVFYYDSTFVGNNYALHNNDFYREITRLLQDAGWQVVQRYLGRPMGHAEKHALINSMLRGRANYQVLINRDNNPHLITSITSAAVYNGKKDKRGEKLAETEEDRLEARTDGSDAFDTLCIGIEHYPPTIQQYSTGISFM